MKILLLTFFAVILRFRLLYGQTEYSGKIVEHGEYPYVVSIGGYIGTPYFERYCLGTIISSNWVLTSSGCVRFVHNSTYFIEHGAWWTNGTEKLTRILDGIRHQKYSDSIEYSIRLLRTEIPLKFDSFTQAVNLIPQSKKIPINIQVFTIAWGSEEDREVYNSTLLETRKWNTVATPANFVYRNISLGAPLISDGNQIGMITSTTKNIFYYSDLSVHLNWIYRTINFYEFKEEYSYYKNVEPNCIGTPESNNILDICCTYPYGYDLLELCISLE